MRATLVGVVLTATLVSATSAAPVLAGTVPVGPYVVLNDHFYMRPSFTFEVVNAARNVYLGRSRWETWSSSGATGSSTLFTNTCRPSCGEGNYSEERVRVRLFDVSTCRARQVFSSFAVVGSSGETLLSGSFRGLGYLRDC
jgi:hypothetical protein